jgi:hypothetical protein
VIYYLLFMSQTFTCLSYETHTYELAPFYTFLIEVKKMTKEKASSLTKITNFKLLGKFERILTNDPETATLFDEFENSVYFKEFYNEYNKS